MPGQELTSRRSRFELGVFLGGLVAFFVVAAAGGEAGAKVPRALAGKVFFSADPVSDLGQAALIKRFTRKKPTIKLTRPKTKDSRWKTTLVAFFRKPSVDGPVTVWIYDRADPKSIKAKEPVHVASINAKGPGEFFVHELTLNPDVGFNRKHTYVVYVGQIIGKKTKYYARGTIPLK